MRISEWTGVWLKYRDSARPVITLNQVTYAFNNDARECLVSREDHVRYFLETGQYRIAGIEVEEVASMEAPPVTTSRTHLHTLPRLKRRDAR